MTEFSLNQQIEEVERELALRRRVYPGWVARGNMRQSEAEYHMARMEAVSKTLRELRASAETPLDELDRRLLAGEGK